MSVNTAHELSVVIPAYNEENAIISTVEEIHRVLSAAGITYEIVLVNDGSSDRTGKRLDGYLKENPELSTTTHLIHHERNRGYGASLKTGIRRTRYATVAITDADSTYPNNRLPELLDEYIRGGYDMVVGQRSFKKLPTLTKPAKWFISKLANFLVGDNIKDINSGLRIFDKQIAMKFFPIICEGFSFTTTITLAMITNHYAVRYIPIEYNKRKGKSKIRPIRDTLNFIALIIRTVMYFNPLKIFIPISLIMFLLSVTFFVMGQTGILFKESPNDTITVLFVGGIQVLVTGMIADLIDKRISK
jgi:glycosyltransferase involved in cell wall biosynthesis